MGDVIEVLTTATNTVEVAATGPQGTPGVGVPTGGSALQVLRKKTGTDYDTEWAAAGSGSGSVTSVALAGTGLSISGSPVTTSGTITANVSYGTTASTAAEGNDTRIANIRTSSIDTRTNIGAGGNINTSGGADGAGGSISTFNGGGSINTSGGDDGSGGSINTNNRGGSIDTRGAAIGLGGSINTSAGEDGVGGSIETYNGGGSINTRGTGSIGLGVTGTRTTLTGTATADRAISLPNASGTLATTAQAADYEVTDSTKGIILKSPNSTRWRVTINNDGTLSRAALALMTLLAFAASGFAQLRDMVTDTNGNIVTGRTNVLTFSNSVNIPISSGAATTNSLLTADGAGGSSFVVSRTQTVAMTNSAFRTNTTDSSATNAQTNMVLNLDASSTYHFAFAFIITSATTGGFNARLLHSNTTNGLRSTYVGRMGRPINIAASDITASSAGAISLQAVNFAGTNIVVTGTGILSTGTSSGTLSLIWYQNTATNVATELVAGSMITITKINP